MYAIIKAGGKQYRVTEGQELNVEKLAAEAGSSVNFDEVLMLADGENIKVGVPLLESAMVSAEVVSQGRAKKVEIIKFKRRKHHMKRMGHRQSFTRVKIVKITGLGE